MLQPKIKYHSHSSRLIELLEADQAEYSNFTKKELASKDPDSISAEKAALHKNFKKRADEAIKILEAIGEPSLSNIGPEAAKAISILATHNSLHATQIVLAAFESLYSKDKDNTYYQSIPAMKDWSRILERKPQIFGTIWELDNHKYPFLITVENFEKVDERRDEYGIGPLRWPKSLAMPLSKQPWLEEPLSKLVIRNLTNAEWSKYCRDYL